MKEAELRQHATCSLCGKKILHAGIPLFYKVTVERFGILYHAVKQQTGLAEMLGSAQLAAVMGPDKEMTETVLPQVVLTVCEPCSLESTASIAALPAIAAYRQALAKP